MTATTDKLSRKTKFSFIAAGFGQNCVIAFVNTFLMTYLVEGLGFLPATIAIITTIMTVAKVWDAVNDPMMGVIVDRTKTRWGKLRPFILFSALPVAILTVMLFSIPNIGETGQIIYFGIVFILWGMFYTVCDVPYWGLAGSMTQNISERTKVISFARTFGTIALGIIVLLGPMLAKQFSGGETTTAAGWSWTAVLISIVGMGLFTLAFFGTKEKIKAKTNMTIKQTFKNMVRNKPLFLTILTSVIGFGRNIVQIGGMVIVVILYNDEGKYMFMGAAIIVAMALATLLTPLMLKKFTKKTLMLWCNILSVAVYSIMFFLGFSNFIIVLVMIFLTGLLSGFFLVLQTSMIADSVDYLQLLTGERNEGICFAGLTFSSKLMGALATLAFGLTLTVIQYSKGVFVSHGMMTGLYFGMTIVPAISCALSIIPMLFYNINERNLENQIKELNEQTAKNELLSDLQNLQAEEMPPNKEKSPTDELPPDLE